MLNTLGWKNLEAIRRDSRLNLMCNITHNSTAVSAEELGMVAADGRTKASHHFKFRAMGAVTAQLHGSFVVQTIPEWNRLPAAAADAVSPTLFHSRLNATSTEPVCKRVELILKIIILLLIIFLGFIKSKPC